MILNGRNWKIPVVEKHHVWFAINAIAVSILLRSLFVKVSSSNLGLLYFVIYIVGLISLVKILSLLLFMFSFPVINRFKSYETKNPLGVDDFNLGSASIVTSFIAGELWNLMSGYILILIIIPIFYITYWINKKIRLPT